MMRLRHFALPGIFWLFVAYLFIPIIVMAAMGFRDSNFVAFPIQSWTTRWYQSVLFDKDIAQSLWLSLKVLSHRNTPYSRCCTSFVNPTLLPLLRNGRRETWVASRFLTISNARLGIPRARRYRVDTGKIAKK